ncbi:MAG: HAMP domain-containing histidine kinase [Clostridia bacterium]|nr:HAMP domain-containing histidine kinase [Clostridia bacterium]
MSNKNNNIEVLKRSKRIFNISIILIDLITVVLTYFIMPVVQNFPPLSEDFGFQELVQPLTHIEQYSIVFILGISIHLIAFRILMRNIKKYIDKYSNNEEITTNEIFEIRKACQNVPYKVLIMQMSLFVSIGIIFNLIMLVQFFTIVKFTLMIIAITLIVSLLTFIATQRYLNQVWLSTYDVSLEYKKNVGYRINNTRSLILQTIPFIAVLLVILSLIGYAKATEQKGMASANYYKVYLTTMEKENKEINQNNLIVELDKIPLNNLEDSYFIVNPYTQERYNSNVDKALTDFALQYKNYFYSDFTEGMIYEGFGSDEQIYAKNIVDNNGENWLVGFKFSIVDKELLFYYFAIIISLVLVYSVILRIWAKNMSNNIRRVSNNLKQILDTNTLDKESILPILSNDEIGDLSYYYNKIQDKLISQQDIISIQSKFSAIGEVAAGMAHDINSPASAIDGTISLLYDFKVEDASEEEYKILLDNMKLAIDKILKIVNNAREQFRNHDNLNKEIFTLNEVLMSIKSAEEPSIIKERCSINIEVDKEIKLYGVKSKLYQVIVNLVRNSLNAYKDNNLQGEIFINATEKKDETIIIIKDNAGGIPNEIKSDLFNKILTTRGTKGTGLRIILSS